MPWCLLRGCKLRWQRGPISAWDSGRGQYPSALAWLRDRRQVSALSILIKRKKRRKKKIKVEKNARCSMPWHCQTPRSYLPKLMTWNSLTLCQVTSWNVNMFCLKEYHKSARTEQTTSKMKYRLISNPSHVTNQLAGSWWAVIETILTLVTPKRMNPVHGTEHAQSLLSKGQHGCSSPRHLHHQPVEIAASMVLSTLGKLFKLLGKGTWYTTDEVLQTAWNENWRTS